MRLTLTLLNPNPTNQIRSLKHSSAVDLARLVIIPKIYVQAISMCKELMRDNHTSGCGQVVHLYIGMIAVKWSTLLSF